MNAKLAIVVLLGMVVAASAQSSCTVSGLEGCVKQKITDMKAEFEQCHTKCVGKLPTNVTHCFTDKFDALKQLDASGSFFPGACMVHKNATHAPPHWTELKQRKHTQNGNHSRSGNHKGSGYGTHQPPSEFRDYHECIRTCFNVTEGPKHDNDETYGEKDSKQKKHRDEGHHGPKMHDPKMKHFFELLQQCAKNLSCTDEERKQVFEELKNSKPTPSTEACEAHEKAEDQFCTCTFSTFHPTENATAFCEEMKHHKKPWEHEKMKHV